MDEAAGKPTAGGALDGIRVLDLTRVLSGPYGTLLLADLGAEIWKVEHPVTGDETRELPPHRGGESHYFMSMNRNKSSLAIDLKDPRGRDLVLGLAREADVVIENFRPGVAGRLGLGYPDIEPLNPRVVYCSISAFGQDGPAAQRTAYDVAIQALGGLMSLTGEPGRPPVRAGVPIADLAAGMLADLGILAALLRRERTGLGQFVDASMLDGTISLLSYFAGRFLLTGEEVRAVGAGHPSVVPYGLFPTMDGQLVLATLSESYWPRLCDVLEMPAEARDPALERNADRLLQRERVERLVADALRRRTTADWEARLLAADIPYAPVLSVGQALQQPQVVARGLVQSMPHPRLGDIDVVGSPLRLSESPAPDPRPAPLLGEHTRQILHRVLGVTHVTLDSLERDGVLSADPNSTGPDRHE
ncbi:MAG: L-carnitine dehydratase/bile acid-inducible protein [Mycobacterium sp.]|nr:L-carnitine dehydratase/bile acid-inducible protein [Mycobacterium sp.]